MLATWVVFVSACDDSSVQIQVARQQHYLKSARDFQEVTDRVHVLALWKEIFGSRYGVMTALTINTGLWVDFVLEGLFKSFLTLDLEHV